MTSETPTRAADRRARLAGLAARLRESFPHAGLGALAARVQRGELSREAADAVFYGLEVVTSALAGLCQRIAEGAPWELVARAARSAEGGDLGAELERLEAALTEATVTETDVTDFAALCARVYARITAADDAAPTTATPRARYGREAWQAVVQAPTALAGSGDGPPATDAGDAGTHFETLYARLEREGGEAVRDALEALEAAPHEAAEWHSFVRRHAHQIARGGAIALLQCAWTESEGSIARRAAREWLRTHTTSGPWLRRVAGGQDADATPWTQTLDAARGRVAWVRDVLGGCDIVSASDGGVRVWRRVTGACVHEFGPYAGGVGEVSIERETGRALMACGDDAARVADLATGAVLATLRGHEDSVTAVAADWSRGLALTGGFDQAVAFWDLATGARRGRWLGHEGTVTAVALAGDRGLSAGEDGVLRAWDLTTGRCVGAFEAHASGVARLALHPGGGRVISLGADGDVAVWELTETLRRIGPREAVDATREAAWSPDGASIVTLGADGMLRVWTSDMARGVRARGGWGRVRAFDVRPDGGIVAALDDETVRTSLESQDEEAVLQAPPGGCVAVAWSSNGRGILAGTQDGRVLVGGVAAGGVHARRGPAVVSVALAPSDGRVMVARATEGGVEVSVGPEADDAEARVVRGFGEAGPVVLEDDGRRGLTGRRDGFLETWNLTTCTRLRSFPGHWSSVIALAVSSDGRRVASLARWEFRLWDLETGTCLAVFEDPPGELTAVSFTAPDGRALWVGCGAMIYAFDAVAGRCERVLPGPSGVIRCIAATRSGDRALSIHDDRTAHFWDVSRGERVARWDAAEAVTAAALDASRAVFGSADGQVEVLVWEKPRNVEHPTASGPRGP